MEFMRVKKPGISSGISSKIVIKHGIKSMLILVYIMAVLLISGLAKAAEGKHQASWTPAWFGSKFYFDETGSVPLQ